MRILLLAWVGLGVALSSVSANAAEPATAQQDNDASDLAKQTQNPGAPLASVPFQFNFNGSQGRYDRNQMVLNVQPVLPLPFSKRWALITRWVIPILIQPNVQSATGDVKGFGDINPQFFFTANLESGLTLGLGPTFLLPTATDTRLGLGRACIGPALLAVYTKGPFVVGALATQIFAIDKPELRDDVMFLTVQPFVNLNFSKGTYLVSAPLITHDWEASRTYLPVGGGFGKLFMFNSVPVNLNAQMYGNAKRPPGGATWQFRMAIQFLFPQANEAPAS